MPSVVVAETFKCCNLSLPHQAAEMALFAYICGNYAARLAKLLLSQYAEVFSRSAHLL
ncbi:hypothetical protein [Aerosakkonema funiforme]|uniref:Uncharacterized protein n=1 Tax=Aerosakkonema funiforme FACHB-1375 TaxID=2949571 RepID=A0A926ZK82_9CYAN|nr:hypothetical protein [Aerosakkonema funiforme]MBD2185499.1 hypothetical protein [Aerosakkonema funiforme FACHB-1375]